MAWLIDALVDVAKIVMKVTRPTPTINAAALDAVRFGFRVALSLASLPDTPRSFGNGQPITRLRGSETVRPSTDTAKNTTTALNPTIDKAFDPPPNSPRNRP